MKDRQADLLPIEYYHVVFTLPAPIAEIAYYNKAVIYRLMFAAASEALLGIAADPKHLGAKIGATLVLHTWGSTMVHHPHVHGIVTGGGLSLDGQRWISCRPGFLLPGKVLSRRFRTLFLRGLREAHRNGELQFFSEHVDLADAEVFADWLGSLREDDWYFYLKEPFAGPEAVLAYLSRYTHRVAISNSRLISMDERRVSFRYKDYRAGQVQLKTMTLDAGEFIRRFLLHVLPSGLHRIRHYGLLANPHRREQIALAREKLSAPQPVVKEATDKSSAITPAAFVCPHCGAPMIVIDTLVPEHRSRAPPPLGCTA